MIAVEVSSSLEAKQCQEAVGDSSEAFKSTTSCDAVMVEGQKISGRTLCSQQEEDEQRPNDMSS